MGQSRRRISSGIVIMAIATLSALVIAGAFIWRSILPYFI